MHLSQPHGSRTAAIPAALVGSACSVMPDVSRRDSAGGESGSASAAPSPPAGVGILTESADMTPRQRRGRRQDSAGEKHGIRGRSPAYNRNPLRDRDLANTLLIRLIETRNMRCVRDTDPSALLRHWS